MRVVANGGVGTAMGRRHFFKHGVGGLGRELVLDQFDEFGEYESQHESSRQPLWIARMLGSRRPAHRSKRAGFVLLSALDVAAAGRPFSPRCGAGQPGARRGSA